MLAVDYDSVCMCVCVLKYMLAYIDYNEIYQTLTEATSRWWDYRKFFFIKDAFSNTKINLFLQQSKILNRIKIFKSICFLIYETGKSLIYVLVKVLQRFTSLIF